VQIDGCRKKASLCAGAHTSQPHLVYTATLIDLTLVVLPGTVYLADFG
jgi:hypothetical protein